MTRALDMALGWRPLKRFAPDVNTTYCEILIPPDIKLIRGNFGAYPVNNDVNLGCQFSFDSNATFLGGASDYTNTYEWLNSATVLARAFGSLAAFGTMSGPGQTGVATTGSFDLSPSKAGSALAIMDTRASHVPGSGQTQQFHGTIRVASALGRISGMRLFFSGSQFQPGSFISVEGIS